MSTHRFGRASLSLAVLALAISLAACTSGAGTSSSPSVPAASSGGSGAEVVWREFVACARSNGQQLWPDPVVDDQGAATFPQVDGWDAKSGFEAVRQDCGPTLANLPARANPYAEQPITEARLRLMRDYVECLHANGMPDVPEPDAQGRIHEPERYRTPEMRDVYNAARNACDHMLLEFTEASPSPGTR